MSPDVIGYIVGAVIAALASVYAVRAGRTAAARTEAARTAISQSRVDGEAYERAQKFNQDLAEEMSREIARLRRELGELTEQLKAERSRSSELDRKIRTLQNTVNRMTELLEQHNVPLPQIGA